MDSNEDLPAMGVEGVKDTSLGEFTTIGRKELELLRARAAAAPVEAPEASDPEWGRDPLRGNAVEEASGAGNPGANAVSRVREEQMAREIAARDRRLADLEKSCKAAVRDRELATALAGKPLVAGAANQLIKLWRDEFEAYEDGGSYKVACRDGRTIGQVVNDWLASPEYSHFCLPTSRGGTGARDANRPGGNTSPQGEPRNLGESIVMKWREESASKPNSVVKPIGLRRHR
jgi:hypothetical protein